MSFDNPHKVVQTGKYNDVYALTQLPTERYSTMIYFVLYSGIKRYSRVGVSDNYTVASTVSNVRGLVFYRSTMANAATVAYAATTLGNIIRMKVENNQLIDAGTLLTSDQQFTALSLYKADGNRPFILHIGSKSQVFAGQLSAQVFTRKIMKENNDSFVNAVQYFNNDKSTLFATKFNKHKIWIADLKTSAESQICIKISQRCVDCNCYVNNIMVYSSSLVFVGTRYGLLVYKCETRLLTENCEFILHRLFSAA